MQLKGHVSESGTHRDSVATDEAGQAAPAVSDGELSAVLNVRARLLGVVAAVDPWRDGEEAFRGQNLRE